MPVYDYSCSKCEHRFERILYMSESDKKLHCPKCGAAADRVFINGHGGIRRPDSAWVKDAAMVLTDTDQPNPNLNTVEDLRGYLSAHPEIVPAESHPAFPSSIGDVNKIDVKEQKRQRAKDARKLIRRRRRVEINQSAGQA